MKLIDRVRCVAARTFDLSHENVRPVKRQAMQRARANLNDSIRVPAEVFDILPTVRTAAETGIDTRDVEKALSVGTTVAIETPVGDDGAQR